ncbi:hypothetical protein [Bacillus cereus]
MKITAELIKEIEEMEKANFPEEKIKKYLKLNRSIAEVKEEFRKYDGYVTVADAVEILKPHLGTLKDDKSYELKILRLIKGDEKRGVEPQIEASKPSNKIGYRIKKEEIERFITDSKKSKEDWRKEAKKWEEQALHYKKLYEESLGKKPSEATEDIPEGQMNIEDVTVEEVKESVNTEESEAPEYEELKIGPVSSINVIDIDNGKYICTVEFKINGVKIETDAFLEDFEWRLSDEHLSELPFEEIAEKIIPKLKREWGNGKGKKVKGLR